MVRQTPASGPFLVVAITGRALAMSAMRGGYRVVVLDCFADRDTRELAGYAARVARGSAIRFDDDTLLGEVANQGQCAGVVYGSGFEGRTELLARVAAGRELYGNSPEVVRRVRDPRQFFPLLERLGITHPEVRYGAPPDLGGWLVKDAGGSGGAQVRAAGKGRPGESAYYQRLEPGRTLSALFLANRKRALIVGFNEQWASGARPERPFLYGGAVGSIQLPEAITADLRARLNALVAATGLVGLNGLDFLLEGERWSALELNPRPTATMELYDPDYAEGLFAVHVAACRGKLPPKPSASRGSRAHLIVTAPLDLEIPNGLEFPGWCRDIPMPGTHLSQGDPVCTVHAEAATPEEVSDMARSRAAEVVRLLRGAPFR